MSQPYVGQIIMFGGNFAPSGWMTCSGQTLPISENDVLFQLIGTTYGGDGEETFNLPDLQGRVPIHQGHGSGLSSYVIGQSGGSENVTLSTNQIPAHNHQIATVNTGGTSPAPSASVILSDEATTAPGGGNSPTYLPPGGTQVTLPAAMIGGTGGNQPHSNIQPINVVTYCIALFGVFPSQN